MAFSLRPVFRNESKQNESGGIFEVPELWYEEVEKRICRYEAWPLVEI